MAFSHAVGFLGYATARLKPHPTHGQIRRIQPGVAGRSLRITRMSEDARPLHHSGISLMWVAMYH